MLIIAPNWTQHRCSSHIHIRDYCLTVNQVEILMHAATDRGVCVCVTSALSTYSMKQFSAGGNDTNGQGFHMECQDYPGVNCGDDGATLNRI